MSPRPASTRWRCSTLGIPKRRSWSAVSPPAGIRRRSSWPRRQVPLHRQCQGIGEDVNPASSRRGPPSGMVSHGASTATTSSARCRRWTWRRRATARRAGATISPSPPPSTPRRPRGRRRVAQDHARLLHPAREQDVRLDARRTAHFGPFASLTFNDARRRFTDAQYTAVAKNTQALAARFAIGVNYYSDAEESDAGHQFSTSGITSDYTEKTPR